MWFATKLAWRTDFLLFEHRLNDGRKIPQIGFGSAGVRYFPLLTLF